MFLVAVMFFTLSDSKKIVLLKMDGYSCFDIVGHEIAANLIFDSILVLTLSIATIVTVRFVVGYSLLSYIKETSNIFLSAFFLPETCAFRHQKTLELKISYQVQANHC